MLLIVNSASKHLLKHPQIILNTDGGDSTADRAHAISQTEQQTILRFGFCKQ